MTTLSNRLASVWQVLNRARRRPNPPRLDVLGLSDHALADLNLRPSERAGLDLDRCLEVDRMRDVMRLR